MCINKLRLLNRTNHYVEGKDVVYNFVPCGNCYECIKAVRGEWFIRSYGEYKYYQSMGGRVMFVTLTYGPGYLPTFDKYGFSSLKNEHGENQSCFDYEHLKSFYGKLKSYYQRLTKSGCGNMSFLFCPEYGHDYSYRDRAGNVRIGTARPHWHILLFFPPSSRLLSNKSLKLIVEKAWIYGFTLFSREEKGGAFVTNVQAIKYVSKYVSKQLDFYNLPAVAEYKRRLASLAKEEKRMYPDVKETDKSPYFKYRRYYRRFKRCLPRHYQSENYGFEYLKYCFVTPAKGSTQECKKYAVSPNAKEYIAKGIKPDLSEYYYKIPRYVFNKLCYQYKSEGEHGFRYLTPLGKEIMSITAQVNIEKRADKLKHIISPLGIHEFCTDVEFKNKFHIDPYKFCGDFWTMLGKRSLRDLVTYQIVYKDIVIPGVGATEFLKINKNDSNYFTENALSFLNYRISREHDNVNMYDVGFGVRHINEENIKNKHKYNDLEAFKYFDVMIGYVEAIKEFRLKQLRAQYFKEKEIKRTKELFT